MNIPRLLEEEQTAINAELERLLPAPDAWPSQLHRAMRYAVFAGGKRVRPILARLAHRAAGGEPGEITAAACGLEMIHTYSLVHDDLPAIDNDVLRRGQPTVHVAFDEATAVLVGDALLTEGLRVLATFPEGAAWAARRADAVAIVADAISSRGMVGGQMEDIEATGQSRDGAVDPALRLERIHRHKTGRLLQASVEIGAVLAGVADETRRQFADFGAALGLAFQVTDDILDATATAEEIGKSPGKDEADGKLTYVTLYGLDSARAKLDELETALVALATEIEGGAGSLAAFARFVCRRSS